MNPSDPRTWHRIERIKRELKARDVSQLQLAEILAMGDHVRDYVRHFVEKDLAHVVGWVRKGNDGRHVPVLRGGPGKSIPKPAAKTGAQRKADAKARLKADKERYERHLAGQRARRKKLPRQDEMINALFGRT